MTIKVSSLKLRDRNPRTITEEALGKLAVSIKRDPEYMALRPIIVDENNIILGGNQRLKAIKLLGMESIPRSWVKQASELTEEQKRRFVLVDNAPAGMAGEWDYELLIEEWEKMELEGLGFSVAPIDYELPIDNKDIDEEAMKETSNECPNCGFRWQKDSR